ncbi:kelch-like protein 31 [Perognathus longimembris pacificus]|uniref:kelch-like protein 31 n=1 Tax=Perognathus longimembris pacificus TaxID=214514 RepID=UPI002019294D|nr:kelch-like protein 31 [Perognathus longimembris pacificus]XP_048203560.1 kelch-like protein 31 [Perognathus longimembris pacificus]
MAPKRKSVKKNKADLKETTIIVEESPLSKLNALNELLEGGNGLSCISSELTDASYGPNLLEGLSKMRQESFLCDLVIGTKTKSFDVHKSVMASCSEYFYNVLKKDPAAQRVDLNDVSPPGLATVIAYAYTGKLTLSLYTIGSVVSAAVYLQIHTLVKMCSDFLIREMSVENCMYVANIAETYSLKTAKAAAQKFIRDNFIEFAESDQFMKLTFEQINELLIDDDLQLPSEIVAFQIAMKWLEFDQKRMRHAADLLSNIRFGTISAQDLVNYVQSVPRMMEDADCHKLLVDAMNYHLLPYHQNTLQSRRTRIRGGCRVLVAVGGRPDLPEKSPSRDVLYRDPENGWSKLTEMPAKSFNQCVAVMDGFLYVAGGEDQNDARNQAKHAVSSFCRYDPRFNTWLHLSSMGQKRTHFSLSALDGLLYAAGGRNAQGSLASLECYVPATNQWLPRAPMAAARCCHASAVAEGRLLVTGGYVDGAYSGSVCAYDPAADAWRELPALGAPRGWHCALALGGRVLVLGGSRLGARGERVDVLAVESLGPGAPRWSPLAPLPVGASTAGAAALRGRAFLLGGWNEGEKRYKRCVQSFSPELNQWTDEDELPEAAVGLSACSLPMPSRATRESRASSVSSVPVSI